MKNMGIELEFVSWWGALTETDLIKYYFNIHALPGNLREYKERHPGTSSQREYGDPTSHRPYYYCHFHDVDDSYISIGSDNYRFRNRSRYDWKEHWLDYQLAKQKAIRG
jgi:hypothetical protein